MLPVELEMAALEEDSPVRGLEWSEVTTGQVQMQLSMEREAGKMNTMCLERGVLQALGEASSLS